MDSTLNMNEDWL